MLLISRGAAMRATASDTQLTRRMFLRATSGIVSYFTAGSSMTQAASSMASRNCIMLFLTGGPSQLETFDPKPDAPSWIRGPWGVTKTRLPGVLLSEHLPRTARIMDRIALIRTMHHDAAPIHETGQRLLQTGRLGSHEWEPPHVAAVLGYLQPPLASASWAVIPGAIVDTGVAYGHGQTAGHLGFAWEPRDAAALRADSRFRAALNLERESTTLRDRYGRHPFGESCCRARRLVESGIRFVTVNMFDTVFDAVTWDCHADGGSLATTLDDYRSTLCPMFDQAFSTLIDDLDQRGLLDHTLVLAMGEFGRTPRLNPRGGRDHWTGCWSVILAGGGIRGGQVIGRSDAWAGEPVDRPVTPAELAATVFALHGFDPNRRIPGPDGQSLPLADAEPIHELMG